MLEERKEVARWQKDEHSFVLQEMTLSAGKVCYCLTYTLTGQISLGFSADNLKTLVAMLNDAWLDDVRKAKLPNLLRSETSTKLPPEIKDWFIAEFIKKFPTAQ